MGARTKTSVIVIAFYFFSAFDAVVDNLEIAPAEPQPIRASQQRPRTLSIRPRRPAGVSLFEWNTNPNYRSLPGQSMEMGDVPGVSRVYTV